MGASNVDYRGSRSTSPTPEQIQDIARTISETGPDPVMLASVIVFGLIAVGTIIFLIRSYNKQQNRTLEYFQERSSSQEEAFRTNLDHQRDQFREELQDQRKVHIVELNRQSEMFERSLDKIVETHKRGMEELSNKLGSIDDRLVHVESVVTKSGAENKPSPRSEKDEQELVPLVAVMNKKNQDQEPKPARRRTRRNPKEAEL